MAKQIGNRARKIGGIPVRPLRVIAVGGGEGRVVGCARLTKQARQAIGRGRIRHTHSWLQVEVCEENEGGGREVPAPDIPEAGAYSMDEDRIARILEEIRDLQREHADAYQQALRAQAASVELQRSAVGRARRLLAALGVVIALVLVIVLVLLAYVLRRYT